ncbi:unnamed protein product [Trichogramma brassicae]|uniref:superoxide dismutase n=1 Tax=Trichogramma brassicae TaxID=86971 RepID=A0A6H5IFU8_9HYME|nr:unnamed protein product [Trichogramma brassicae]
MSRIRADSSDYFIASIQSRASLYKLRYFQNCDIFKTHETKDYHLSFAKITLFCSSVKRQHGGPDDFSRHVGDLGNVLADAQGVAHINMVDRQIALLGNRSIVGRAFVVHALPDDLGRGGNEGSRTTGNAGDRLACGVIVNGTLIPLMKKDNKLFETIFNRIAFGGSYYKGTKYGSPNEFDLYLVHKLDHWSIDLEKRPFRVVPKPLYGSVWNDNLLWRLSFSENEKAMLNKNGAVKSIIKLMKMIVQKKSPEIKQEAAKGSIDFHDDNCHYDLSRNGGAAAVAKAQESHSGDGAPGQATDNNNNNNINDKVDDSGTADEEKDDRVDQSGLIVVPSYTIGWFDYASIHHIERRALPEFFNNVNPLSKTPEMYLFYRNFMIDTYRLQPSDYLTLTACRRNLPGDVCALARIHGFLEQWGLINYRPRMRMYLKPRKPKEVPCRPYSSIDSTAAAVDSRTPTSKCTTPKSLRTPANESESPQTPRSAQKPKIMQDCYVKLSDVLQSGGGRNQNHDERSLPKLARSRIERRKVLALLFKAITSQGEEQSDASTKTEVESITTRPEWTEVENSLLHEALEIYTGGRNDWEKVSQHVGTRSLEECVLHFLHLPSEDPRPEESLYFWNAEPLLRPPEPLALMIKKELSPLSNAAVLLAAMVHPRVLARAIEAATRESYLGKSDPAVVQADKSMSGILVCSRDCIDQKINVRLEFAELKEREYESLRAQRWQLERDRQKFHSEFRQYLRDHFEPQLQGSPQFRRHLLAAIGPPDVLSCCLGLVLNDQ